MSSASILGCPRTRSVGWWLANSPVGIPLSNSVMDRRAATIGRPEPRWRQPEPRHNLPMRTWFGLAALAAAIISSQAPRRGQPTDPEEKSAGWRLLFDAEPMPAGRPTNCIRREIRSPSRRLPEGRRAPQNREDLFTRQTFQDFDLAFDWKSPRGQQRREVPDSGSPLHPRWRSALRPREGALASARRVREGADYVIGFEYQLTDDATNPDAARQRSETPDGGALRRGSASKSLTRPVGTSIIRC